MNWHLIESGINTGRYNMDFDLKLVQQCTSSDAFLRLYKWKPYCISLGANQNFEDISIERTQNDNIDIVKRPTGGRAILHAEEITYSVVLPFSNNLTPKHIYQKISIALIKGLEKYNPYLGKSELENLQPNFPELIKQPNGVLCFGSTAKNEVKYFGKKIIGSAQRKLNRTILQHGSILCGTYHKKLVEYINTDYNTRQNLVQELADKTIEIETITGKKVNYEKLQQCLIDGFAEEWQINFN